MGHAELVIDILSELDERGAIHGHSSIEDFLVGNSTLRDQLARDPALARELENALSALRDLDDCFGLGSGGRAGSLPEIPGYELQGELGAGGMGTVFKAQQLSLKRPVAVKVMWKDALRSRRRDQRFRGEAELVARLEHPHIVQIFETGETPAAHFIVLEYMSAGNLARRLAGRPQPERWCAEVMQSIALAVEYAHGRGVIHRDLKPSNILLAGDGTLKIADFGLAKLLDDASNMTASGEALGTPSYMAPEQTRGKFSERTDVYALGAILYELLTGRPPFSGETAAETLVQVQTSEPIAPRLIRANVSPDLEAICLKCLEKEPAARYASVRELVEDLERYLAGKPTLARPVSNAGRIWRWARSNPRVAGLAAAVAALLLGITLISTFAAIRIGRARDEADRIALRERDTAERERETAQRERTAKDEAARALAAEQGSLAKAVAAELAAKEQGRTAETQAAKAAQVSDFLVNVFLSADPIGTGKLGFRQGEEIGTNITLRDLLDRGARQAQRTLKSQPEARAAMLDTLGKVYSDLGLLDQAEPLVREAYALRQMHPENETDLATSLLNMGVLMRWKGEYREAESMLRRAVEIRTRMDGPESMVAAEAEFALCWLLLEIGRWGQNQNGLAMIEFDRGIAHVLEVQRRELGAGHRDVGVTLAVMALRQLSVRNLAEVQKLILQAGLVFVQQDGGQPLAKALVEFQRASTARHSGKPELAEKHYLAAVEGFEQVFGRKYIFTLMIKMDLAGFYRQVGHAAEFERVFAEVVDSFTALDRVFPHGHPALQEDLDGWAYFLEDQGRYDEAIRFHRKNIDISVHFSNIAPEDEISHTFSIARVRVNQGRLDEAASGANSMRATIEKRAGSEDYFEWQINLDLLLASIELARENFAAAEPLYRDCLRRGRWHQVQPATDGLVVCIHALRPDDPEPLQLARGYVGTSWSPFYPNSAISTLLAAELLVEQKSLDEAAKILQPACDWIYQKTHPNGYVTGLADGAQGKLLAAQGKLEEAERRLLASLENLRKSRGEHHWLTRKARESLVAFYRQNQRDADAERYAVLPGADLPVAVEAQ